MSLTLHPIWPELSEWIRLEVYDRDGGHEHPRHRIELDAPRDDVAKLGRFVSMEMACVHCGRTIHPVRQRKGGGLNLFIAVTCDLETTTACARSGDARDEYERIIEAVKGLPPREDQPSLFA